jgi:opacity protein-like surface antigen
MQKLLFVSLLSVFISLPAVAADQSKWSAGAGYGFNYNGVLSLHADYDISDQFKNEPVKARFGYDSYTINSSGYSWGYNVFYAGAYYDFNKALQLDNKLHPFAGLGLGFGTTSCSGNLCNGLASPSVGGVYVIAGLQYDVKPNINIEASVNGWDGLLLGANYKF